MNTHWLRQSIGQECINEGNNRIIAFSHPSKTILDANVARVLPMLIEIRVRDREKDGKSYFA